MRLYQLILIILIAALIGCQGNKGEIIITGKIIGDIPNKIEYTVPINGICNYGFKESAQPDSSGNFHITVNIDEPSFVTLIIPGKLQSTLPVEPGENYDVNFNLDSKENVFKVTGKSHKGQNAYSSLPKPGHIQRGARKFLKEHAKRPSQIKELEKQINENYHENI